MGSISSQGINRRQPIDVPLSHWCFSLSKINEHILRWGLKIYIFIYSFFIIYNLYIPHKRNFKTILLNLLGWHLVNNIKLVSGVQFYNTSSVYCIVCLSPQVKSPSVTMCPLCTLFYLPPPPSPSGSHRTVVCLYEVFSLSPITCFIQPLNPSTLLPSDSCQSVLCIYESVSILLVYFIRFHI